MEGPSPGIVKFPVLLTPLLDIHLFTEMTECKESEWVRRYQLSWAEWAGVRVLRRGRVPRHVAVIMDGNRRYARMAGAEVSLPIATIDRWHIVDVR